MENHEGKQNPSFILRPKYSGYTHESNLFPKEHTKRAMEETTIGKKRN